MSGPGKILIVDDVSANLNVLTDILEKQGYEVLAAPSGAIALSIIQELDVDLILLDIMMPELDGLETSRRIHAMLPHPPPVVFISGGNLQQQLEKAFEAGGVDYINKPFLTVEIIARVGHHLQLAALQREIRAQNDALQAQIIKTRQAEEALSVVNDTLSFISEQEARQWGLPAFIGASEQFRALSEHIKKLQSFTHTHVLILGESGTGKELIARAIHYGSPLAKKPFIAINCSAISEQLAEAEFFGSIKGAYTGAIGNRKGFFEMADGGTLFLDEVGDLPLSMQAKLLRALEEEAFYPVGSEHLKRVSVRIISATNINLEEKMRCREFREDLYFRLAQFTLITPPLRERRHDLPLLCQHFSERFSSQMKVSIPRLSVEALNKLQAYHFPGNIRELRNIIERAVILSNRGIIEAHHIQLADSLLHAHDLVPETGDLSIKTVKRQLANVALEQTQGNISAAAKLLGVHRSWFYRLDDGDVE